jgi:hypothetical protein
MGNTQPDISVIDWTNGFVIIRGERQVDRFTHKAYVSAGT